MGTPKTDSISEFLDSSSYIQYLPDAPVEDDNSQSQM